MNPDCLIPILEQGDLLTWVEAAAAVGGAWLGLFAVSKYLGKREPPRLALRFDGELKFPVDADVPIRRFFALLLDVVHDGLVGHMARTRHEVPPTPYVSAPEYPTESPKVGQHLSGGLALDPLHQLTYRDMLDRDA